MPKAGSFLCLVLVLGLGACFVQHRDLIGVAEPAAPGQWDGVWRAEPLEAGDEPGFFAVKDVDPAGGVFSVVDADADGNATGTPLQLNLRRVGETLFLDVREKNVDPWMLFVVARAAPDRIELAWKPVTATFRQALESGDLAGSLDPSSGIAADEVRLTDFYTVRQQAFARNWQDLFTSERMVLSRVDAAK